MEIGIYAISGSIATVSGIALARFAVGPSFKKEESRWIEIDLDDDQGAEDSFSRVVLEYQAKDGWLVTSKRALAYIKKVKEDEVIAINATCRHLGCIVSWDEESKIFKCPCHNGMYDAEGRVIAGPPPAPLKRHRTKIEDEKIFLTTKTFPYEGHRGDKSESA